jgi:hypothetical protein
MAPPANNIPPDHPAARIHFHIGLDFLMPSAFAVFLFQVSFARHA